MEGQINTCTVFNVFGRVFMSLGGHVHVHTMHFLHRSVLLCIWHFTSKSPLQTHIFNACKRLSAHAKVYSSARCLQAFIKSASGSICIICIRTTIWPSYPS